MAESNVTEEKAQTNPEPKAEPKAEPKKTEPKKVEPKKAGKPKIIAEFDVNSGDSKAMSKLLMPKDESDVLWDAKMRLNVPDSLIGGLSVHGWDRSMPLRVIRGEGDTYRVCQGRTKMRALPEANKRRKANKLPPIVIPVVVGEEDEFVAMRVGKRLNQHQQEVDPITLAIDIERFIAVGHTEEETAEDNGMTVNEVKEHLALLTLPDKVKKMIATGHMSFSAALALTHVDEKRVEAVAQKLVDQAAAVGKVSVKAVKEAAEGKGEADRLNPKAMKKLAEDLKANKIEGKHGDLVREAAMLVIETCLDARKLESFWNKIGKLASGK